MASSRRYEVGVGCLVVGAVGVLAYLALQVGAISGFQDVVHVSATLPDAAGLTEGGVVSIAGVQVGRVDSLGVEFDHAKVTLAIDRSAQVRSDVVLHVRARSVLGEKYVELQPVSTDAPLLEDGATLADTRGQLEIDEMVTRIGPLLDAVDPAALKEAVAILTGALKDDPERVKRMLADAEHTLHNVAVASDELPALVTDARTTLRTVRATADDARPILAHLDGTVERLDTLLAAVPPEQVPALLDEVQAAVVDGRAVLVKLDAATGGLQTLVDKANGITREDILRITQEEGVLIRLKSRSAEDVLEKEGR
jgi:phospholipid/cholesterol/gamma-HCH transport system substrate-binding protein